MQLVFGRIRPNRWLSILTATVLVASAGLGTVVAQAATATISGKVVGPDGATPLQGIEVTAHGAGGDYETVTQANGTYSLTVEAVPGYEVRFDPTQYNIANGTDYHGEYWNNSVYPPTSVNAPAANINATLERGGTISGVITGPGGAGLSGITVVAYGPGWELVTTTGSGGSYSLKGLVPGDHRLYFDPAAYNASHDPDLFSEWYDNVETWDEATPLEVGSGTSTPAINAQLTASGSISGVVSGPTGALLQGIWVTAEGPSYLGAYTEADGTYVIEGLRAGDYRVKFDPLTYNQTHEPDLLAEYYNNKSSWATADLVPVVAGGTKTGIDAELAGGGTITGVVTAAGTSTGLSGVSVTAVIVGTSTTFSTTTGSGGSYSIGGLPTGSYYVVFNPTAYNAANGTDYLREYYNNVYQQADATSVSVTVGTTRSGINAALERGGRITGVVRAPGGTAIPGVMVHAEGPGGGSALTGPDGRYTIGALTPGSYAVRFDPAEYNEYNDPDLLSEYYNNARSAATATAVPVSASATTSGIDATLDVGGALSGTVLGHTGSPVAYVLVRAIGLGVVEGAVGTAYTYTDGKYIVSGLPAGEYAVEFDTAEYNLEPESIVDLAPEFYSEKWVADQADPVTVVASGNTTGIDAGLDQLGTPRIIVSGVEDGGVYREVTAQVEFVDAVSSSITLDGLPYTSGTLIATHGPHVLHAEAEGMTGLTADLTITFSIDAESPSAPTGLTATPISGSRIDLEWNAASDASGIAKYLVYVDGESAPRCEVTSLSCSVVGLTPETPYSFYVVAVDGVGNLSDPSATVEATTLSTPNSPPVLAPVGDKSVSVFSTLSFTATATDDDGDALMFSLGAGAPTGASITSGGLFTWTPTADQGPETYLLTIIVSDGTDTDSETINVTVTVDSALPDGAIRVAGSNRYATSVEASKRGFPDGAKTVVIATGANWPDALGGSALAGAVDGPLLLTKPDALPSEVSTEIKRLGATKAYILGSTAAVSSAVETQLKGLGLTVVRKGGSNRYETARMVADETIRLLGSSYEGHAFVATGLNFPDATGAAPVAAALGRPILLANVTAGTVSLPPAVNKVVILGSTAAVPSKVETYLDTTLGSANVDRLAGANRYDTAARAAQLGVNAGMRWDGTGLATGLNFPDALSGGAMLGKLNSVMLLTRPDLLSGEARTKLYNNRAVIDTLFIFGDTNAVSSAVEVAAKAAATVK